jgi:hypothetical protein
MACSNEDLWWERGSVTGGDLRPVVSRPCVCARYDGGAFQLSRQGLVMASWFEVKDPDLVVLKVTER